MVEQPADRDPGARVGIGDLEPGKVVPDAVVKLDLSRVHELHHRGRRECLADGCEQERSLRGDRAAGTVRLADRGLPNDLAILDRDEGQTRDPELGSSLRQVRVDGVPGGRRRRFGGARDGDWRHHRERSHDERQDRCRCPSTHAPRPLRGPGQPRELRWGNGAYSGPPADGTPRPGARTRGYRLASVSAIRALTSFVTSATGRGASVVNRTVPLDVSSDASSSRWASITAGLCT